MTARRPVMMRTFQSIIGLSLPQAAGVDAIVGH